MGFEPLPFDPRSACFCRQNCASFEQPTSRWWLVWSDPPPSIPLLGVGILVEFSFGNPATNFCFFLNVNTAPGITQVTLSFEAFPPFGGGPIERQCIAFTNVGNGVAENQLTGEECAIPLNIPARPGFEIFGGCNIFPVRWFENANDVPH